MYRTKRYIKKFNKIEICDRNVVLNYVIQKKFVKSFR